MESTIPPAIMCHHPPCSLWHMAMAAEKYLWGQISSFLVNPSKNTGILILFLSYPVFQGRLHSKAQFTHDTNTSQQAYANNDTLLSTGVFIQVASNIKGFAGKLGWKSAYGSCVNGTLGLGFCAFLLSVGTPPSSQKKKNIIVNSKWRCHDIVVSVDQLLYSGKSAQLVGTGLLFILLSVGISPSSRGTLRLRLDNAWHLALFLVCNNTPLHACSKHVIQWAICMGREGENRKSFSLSSRRKFSPGMDNAWHLVSFLSVTIPPYTPVTNTSFSHSVDDIGGGGENQKQDGGHFSLSSHG